MGLLLRREKRQAFPEPPISPYPGVNMFGHTSVQSNPDSALAVPTVWACVSLIANAVSMMSLETFRETPDGYSVKITSPPLLRMPAATMTQSEWLHMLLVSLLLRGNAYGRIALRDGMERPLQIELMHPDQIRLTAPNGKLKYEQIVDGVTTDITADMWHVRGMTMPGSMVGLSPITYAAATLGVDIASRKFAQDFFNGGGIPKAILTSKEEITQAQARIFKERFVNATRNREIVTVGDGVTYQQISVKPEESQFLATQQATVAQIARYFGVPAGLVGGTEGGSMTYSNVEQRSLDFLKFGVSFWLKRIEDAISPLLAQPQFVKFNTDILNSTDAETQAKIDNQQIAGKVVAPSEIRTRRNLPPLTQAQKDELQLVPLEVTPLGGVKAITKPGATPPDSVNVEGTPVNG